MCSSEEIFSFLNDLPFFANYLKLNNQIEFDDSIYSIIANHFLQQSVTIESLSVQRNLYGRIRSSSLNQSEINLLILNIKQCLLSNCQELIKIFLQYLHNLNRLLTNEYEDLSYLCSMLFLDKGDKNVIACILCAYLDKYSSKSIRFDLIINHLFRNENENHLWIDQLKKLIIENDRYWLRDFYLNEIYTEEFLQAIDQFRKEDIFHIESILKKPTNRKSNSSFERFDLNDISTLNDLQLKLQNQLENLYSIEIIQDECLINLFSCLTNYPDDIHLLFSCLLRRNFDSNYHNKGNLRLFRRLINLIDNYYIHQQDLLDDNHYRLMIVYFLSKYLCELHRRRSKTEHPWYKLYMNIPDEHPLPTFDLYSELLCLLSTLTYRNIDCQNQVRLTKGTIESILSMTQIDINQPKAQACVTWLIKCLTETNEENRNYIKQIK